MLLNAACVCVVGGVNSFSALDEFVRRWSHATRRTELGRAFFLAITPWAFAASARAIHEVARPPTPGWLRVVFEKPFGGDVQSASKLAAEVSGVLAPGESFLVDHYLGKGSVRAIAEFRRVNVEAQTLLGRSWHPLRSVDSRGSSLGIERVEAAMAESVDCAGRTRFYDDYGVVRDVMQNHVSQMMALTLCGLDGTSRRWSACSACV